MYRIFNFQTCDSLPLILSYEILSIQCKKIIIKFKIKFHICVIKCVSYLIIDQWYYETLSIIKKLNILIYNNLND